MENKKPLLIIVIVIILVGIIGLLLFNLNNTSTTSKNDVIDTPQEFINEEIESVKVGKTIILGEEFILKNNQSISLIDGNNEVRVRLNGFVTSSFEGGPAIINPDIDLFFNGEIQISHPNSEYGSGDSYYFYQVVENDEKSYVRAFIHRLDLYCESISDQEKKNDCWTRAANVKYDTNFCDRIESETTKSNKSTSTRNRCLEYIAGRTNNDALCNIVTEPEDYCLSIKTIENMDLTGCYNIVITPYKQSCFREIAQKKGVGVEICLSLPDDGSYAFKTGDAQRYCESAFNTLR